MGWFMKITLVACSAASPQSADPPPSEVKDGPLPTPHLQPAQRPPCSVEAGEIPFTREIADIGLGCLTCTCIPDHEFSGQQDHRANLIIASGLDQYPPGLHLNDFAGFFLMPRLSFVCQGAFANYRGGLVMIGNFTRLVTIGISAFESLGANSRVRLTGGANLRSFDEKSFNVSKTFPLSLHFSHRALSLKVQMEAKGDALPLLLHRSISGARTTATILTARSIPNNWASQIIGHPPLRRSPLLPHTHAHSHSKQKGRWKYLAITHCSR
jgi:hypothetical protein